MACLPYWLYFSGAVEITGTMTVDAFVAKTGLKMVSSVHSSSSVKGRVELSRGQIFNLELDMPQDKMEIFNVKYGPGYLIYISHSIRLPILQSQVCSTGIWSLVKESFSCGIYTCVQSSEVELEQL